MTSPLTIAQPGAIPRLRPEHLEHLRRSGLTDATIQAAGIYSVAPEEARRLGFARGVAGIAFPYPSTEVVVDGVTHPYTRLRVDEGRVRRSGLKYENPLRDRIERGLTFYPYVPTAVAALRRDAARPLMLTEGEKKALALTQEGFPAIGLPGVHMFADPTSRQAPGRKPLHPDLRRWAWRGRCVYVCFDSDRVEKDGVALACERLCAALTREGAAVRVVRLPRLCGLTKTGADDFLVREGRAAFQAFVDAAGPWEPFAWVVELLPAAFSPEALPTALDHLRGHVAGASHTELRTVAQRLAARFPALSREAALRLLAPSETSVAPDAPPQVVTSGRQLREVVADAWAALLSSPFRDRVFRHGEALVYAGDEAGAVVGRSPLQPLDADLLAALLNRAATWIAVSERGPQDARLPPDVVRDMLVLPHPELPRIEGVTRLPLVALDGSVAVGAGYDPTSRQYQVVAPEVLAAAAALPTVPDRAAREAARALLLDDLLGEFPFARASDRAHALAALLLPVVRHLVPGLTPLHLVEAPTEGTGKTLLAKVVSLVATGAVAQGTSLPRSEEEIRKKLTATLAGAP
ncbi:MAG: DUF3854 domain-containing protein, partial [Pseudomonadota bacterium]